MQVQRQSNGHMITLDTQLDSGGEGKIYTVSQDPTLVAKVYHQNKLTIAHANKLKLMFVSPPDDPVSQRSVSIAWPVDLLRSTSTQQIIGFLMQRVTKARPIHEFYNPGTRRQKSPYFNYLYLHRTARNLATAVSRLHTCGYVIGDVNESNILVSEMALVTLVDTDSFQVRDWQRGDVHRCPVGKPEFTPPELQGQNFRDIDRTPEHDLFGLAVLIFQLLMEGTHPFEGVFQGSGDPPSIKTRISSGHFPYGSKRVPYHLKPLAPPFDILHPTLRQLFVRCFEDGHNDHKARPDARTWAIALEEAEKALVACAVNSQHRYIVHLGTCPWCQRTARLRGRDPFPANPLVQGSSQVRPALIEQKPPLTAGQSVIPSSVSATISPLSVTTALAKNYQGKNWLVSVGIASVGFIAAFTVSGFVLNFANSFTTNVSSVAKSSPLNKSGSWKPNTSRVSETVPTSWQKIKNSNVVVLCSTAPECKDKGLHKLEEREYKTAIEYFDEALGLEPNDALTYNNQALVYFTEGDYERALTNYNKAISINPNIDLAYFNRGFVYSSQGDYERALSDYNKAISINPNFALAYFNRGLVYSSQGDYQRALSNYNKAISINPNFALAYNNRGDVRFVQGDYQAAITDYDQAIRINPNFALAYFNRGIARSQQKNNQAAIEDFQKAADLFKQQGETLAYQHALYRIREFQQ